MVVVVVRNCHLVEAIGMVVVHNCHLVVEGSYHLVVGRNYLLAVAAVVRNYHRVELIHHQCYCVYVRVLSRAHKSLMVVCYTNHRQSQGKPVGINNYNIYIASCIFI